MINREKLTVKFVDICILADEVQEPKPLEFLKFCNESNDVKTVMRILSEIPCDVKSRGIILSIVRLARSEMGTSPQIYAIRNFGMSYIMIGSKYPVIFQKFPGNVVFKTLESFLRGY